MADGGETGTVASAGAPRREDAADRVPLSSLFLAFLRLGVTAFGGPAMVAYIRDLAVRRRRWLSAESFADGTALCQSIPGATAMQTAAYVGLRVRGARGALAAFVGFGLPAFVLMTVLSAAYEGTRGVAPVTAAFRGLHVIVVALIANALVGFGRGSVRSWRDALLACGAGVFLFLRGNPLLAIAAAAAAGALLHRGGERSDRPAVAGAANPRQTARLLVLSLLGGGAALALLSVLDRRLFELATVMVKTDLSAFGGGFASVPVMLQQIVGVRHWLDGKTFMDGIALGQVTPGPIVITATFVGYMVAGLVGAAVATAAVFAPSFLMVLVTVPYLDRLQRAPLFRRALRGVLASFVGLLLAVTLQFGIAASWTAWSILLAVAALVALRLRADVLWVVLVGAGASILLL